jgi:hypothetical protein
MMGNCGFGMMWLGLLGLVLLVSLIVLSWTAITWLRRHGADTGAQRRPSVRD